MNYLSILSVPRSGSSWVGQILNSSPQVLYKFQPNFSYSFPSNLEKDTDEKKIIEFYENLRKTNDPFVNGKVSISGKSNIEFKKSFCETLVWKEVHFLFLAQTLLEKSDTKVIGLIRSPFAVISSWIKIPKEFDPSWNLTEQWKTANLKNSDFDFNYFGYEKWKEVTQLFISLKQKYPERFYMLQYENLLADPKAEVEKLFSFCNLEVTSQTLGFLTKSTSNNDTDAYSVFKSKKTDDQWKKELPQFIIDEIKMDPEFQSLNKIFKWK